MRLFCLPYAGAGTLAFRTWHYQLPNWLEVCAVQLPGREVRMREPACNDVKEIVRPLAAALSSLLDRPFAIFGHSMGALIAFELARELRRLYRVEPVYLFTSARSAPHCSLGHELLSRLPDRELWAALWALNGMSEELVANPELVQLLTPILRADMTLHENYAHTPQEALTCPIMAIGGEQDQRVETWSLQGWAEHTTGSFELRTFPGDHFFLHSSEVALLNLLTRRLELSI